MRTALETHGEGKIFVGLCITLFGGVLVLAGGLGTPVVAQAGMIVTWIGLAATLAGAVNVAMFYLKWPQRRRRA